MSAHFKSLIAQAIDAPLQPEEARTAFEILFAGDATPAQIGGFLMTLRTRGESVEEITAAVEVMRAKCVPVRAPEGAMDIVGTGGDGKHTLNISTAAAFVVAGSGIAVAKHGNRNLSSKSGTADVQSALGINVMVGAEHVEAALREAGIGFMMAPMHHPAMKHVGPARVELGARTVFNILGPLTNPAGVKRQLTGAYTRDLLRPMAETLKATGSDAAWLCHGSDGTDELTITGVSWAEVLQDGNIQSREVHPEEFGLPTHPFEQLIGGTPAENAAALRAVLTASDTQVPAYRDAVLLNAAAAIHIAKPDLSLQSAVEHARESIASGAALRALEALARVSQTARS